MDLTEALAKEVLIVLFRAFPGHFVLVGGGALHWIFHSPRLSVDIDLKPLQPPTKNFFKELAAALNRELAPWAAHQRIVISCEIDAAAQAIRVLMDGRSALHVELAALALAGAGEKHLLQSDSLQSEIIVTPTLHQLLFSKAAALIKRAHVKGRDAFDIWFLQGRGAVLNTAAFSDWLKWEEIDEEDVRKKLKEITPERLRSDLARFLPESIQKSLGNENYKSLIEAVQRLLEPFT
jgi:hypothetical protein